MNTHGSGKVRPPLRGALSESLGYVETVIYALLAVLLCAAAFMALWSGAWNLFSSFHFAAQMGDVSMAVHELEELLFVLMLVEILHTVKISIESHRLVTEPFLVVAIIASVRRMLVITMETSQLIEGHRWIGDGRAIFVMSLWELGVLGLLVLALVAAIIAMRKDLQSRDS